MKPKVFGPLTARVIRDIPIPGDNNWVIRVGAIVRFLGNTTGGEARIEWKNLRLSVPQDALEKLT